jgi:arylsulfatase A-like enzyme
MDRRGFLKNAALGTAGLWLGRGLASAGADQATRPPNVVYFLVDDASPGYFGFSGGSVLTPHTDSLARNGMSFQRAYVASSVCTPSRFNSLTGRYASRCQSPGFVEACPPGQQSFVVWNTRLDGEKWPLPRALQQGGYATGMVGKWHLGKGPNVVALRDRDADPTDPQVARRLRETQQQVCEHVKSCGFDYAASVYNGNIGEWVVPLEALRYHSMEWMAKGAVDFIDLYHDRPFFLYMPTTLPHSPSPLRSFHADPRITEAGLLEEHLGVMPSRASALERVRAAGLPEEKVANTWLDDGIGAVLKRIEDYGLTEDTIFIFSNDNGAGAQRSGAKSTCYDPGIHVPLLIQWKGHIEPGTTDALAQNIDLAATILDACGVAAPADMHLDGRSLMPVLTGRDAQWRDALFFEIYYSRAVRTDRWKYIAWRYPEDVRQKLASGELEQGPKLSQHPDGHAERYPGFYDQDQLYDLRADPGEQVNLAADPEYQDVLAEMRGRLEEWLHTFPHSFGELRACS